MVGPHVGDAVALLDELVATARVCAREGLLSRVLPHMNLQCAGPYELISADGTDEWSIRDIDHV